MIRTTIFSVPAAGCLATVLLLSGCDKDSGSTTAVPAAERSVTADEPAPDEAAPATDAPATEATDTRATTDVASTLTESGLRKPASTPTTVNTGPIVVVAEPTEINLGQVATGDTGVGTLVLRNTGDESRVVTRIKSSCGCTAANFTPGTALQPGESIDVEVRMKGGTVARNLRKTLTIIVEGQQDQIVPVSADVVAFVTITPEQIGPDRNPDGKVTLRSIDDQPFRILSMTPPVIEEFTEEPQVEHELMIDWDHWNEVTGAQRSRKVIFYTDHPMSAQVYSTVYVTPQRVNPPTNLTDRLNQRANQQAPKPSPYVELSALIKRDDVDGLMAKLEGNENLSINTTDATGATLLAQAAKYGSVSLAQALIDAGADLESTDRTGGTPLMAAAQSKNAEMVNLLLDAGASVTARDNIGRTALSCAAGLGDPASVQALVDGNAEVQVAGAFTGFTPLIWASGFGDPNSIPILVEGGADLEARDQIEGATPLIHAARTGKPGAVEFLVAAGADLENTDKTGKTAFLAAAGASNGTVDKLVILIEAGASPEAKDNRGLTALDFAKKRTDPRSAEVIRFLQELQAKE
ncbi:MAG: ankyrin repeat domain-containing protein [Planctomycetota bacterium]|jgi:ankyrin repeat protein